MAEIRPQTRLGKHNPRTVKMMFWAFGLAATGGGGWAAYHYGLSTEVDIPVQRVRKGDFVISVRTRGDIKSLRSAILTAPQVPGLRIVRMAANGQMVKKGDTIVEFDRATQEQNVLTRENAVASAQGQIDQAVAGAARTVEQDALQKMTSEYNLESAKLQASKAEVISAILGEKDRIQVGVSEGSLNVTKSGINADNVQIDAQMVQLNQAKNNAVKNLDLSNTYLDLMEMKAPVDGIVNILTNFRATGTFGRAGAPPFKEGDNVWTGAQILEIPDVSSLYVDLKLDEVDRGKIALGQTLKIRVDSIPDKEFTATLDFIAPAAALTFTGVGADMSASTVKNFPARATLTSVDERLRPGTSASAEIIIERQPNSLMIPLQASFNLNGKPTVYVQNGKEFAVRQIQIGKQNEEDLVVTGGLKEGDMVALVDPIKATKQAKKKI
jgi:multidrug efflux pump subunit AcrA (membrane-fusion protein)